MSARKSKLTPHTKQLLIEVVRIMPGFGEALLRAAKGEPPRYFEEPPFRSRSPLSETEESERRGKQVTKTKTKTKTKKTGVMKPVASFSFNPTQEMHDALVIRAKLDGCSVRHILRGVLRVYLAKKGVIISKYEEPSGDREYNDAAPKRLRLPMKPEDSAIIQKYLQQNNITAPTFIAEAVKNIFNL